MNEMDETSPLVVDEICAEEEENAVILRPRRRIVVEPFLLLYMLAGVPLEAIQLQYMYQKIARDMGIDLNNLTGKEQ